MHARLARAPPPTDAKNPLSRSLCALRRGVFARQRVHWSSNAKPIVRARAVCALARSLDIDNRGFAETIGGGE
jgi:hypothetical protein